MQVWLSQKKRISPVSTTQGTSDDSSFRSSVFGVGWTLSPQALCESSSSSKKIKFSFQNHWSISPTFFWILRYKKLVILVGGIQDIQIYWYHFVFMFKFYIIW